MFRTIAAITLVYIVTAIGWMILGGTIQSRTSTQDYELRSRVGQLWGTPLEQQAPTASLALPRLVETEETDKATGHITLKTSTVIETLPVPMVKSDLHLNLHLDQRQKGLLWYATYRVDFDGAYEFESLAGKSGEMTVTFNFPAPNGQYDDFQFDLDGKRVPFVHQQGGSLSAMIPAGAPAGRHSLRLHYVSQGMDSFVYRFSGSISEARDFQLVATTDFDGYDFPGNTMSPTEKQRQASGWQLSWKYKSLVTGNGIGVAMPQKLNPGPLAARISFFAPVSLGFFFFLAFVLGILRNLRIHPMNYFFIAGAFFAFHLLLAYLVDHLSIHLSFVICSAVSIFLLLSYLRIVVGARFAFVEFALAQVIYLVGFSYAFFFEGFTGLTVTIGAIVTLFVVMQLTARIDWSEKFRKG